MQKLRMILILCLLSGTVLSQSNDSTYCFTQAQVKTFLMTKAELEFCLESNEVLLNDLGDAQNRNIELETDLTKTNKKLRRTRWIASGGVLSTIILSLIIIL